MAVQSSAHPAPRIAHAVEDEHPAAAQAERLAATRVAIDGVQDPDTEEDEGQADDAAHDRIEPVREDGAEGECRDSEGDDHGAVTERIQRPELHGLELLAIEPKRRPGASAGRRSQGGCPWAGVVCMELVRAAVAVVITGDRP